MPPTHSMGFRVSQSKQRAIEQQRKELIDAETHRIQGKTAATILLQEAAAVANATMTQNHFDLMAFNYTQRNRLISYQGLKASLDYNGTELINYIKVTAADKNSDGAVISIGGTGFGS